MAAKYTSSDETEVKQGRFLDVGQEPRRMLQPIEGYQKMPLLTLDKAVEPIVFCCPDIHRRVFIAMSSCENPLDDLNQNESASIFLYTMEWEPRNECLYYVLNKTLRTENRQQLKPWYSYLRLIITALQKLPPQKLTVWRGVTLDLSREYEIGQRYVWWAFHHALDRWLFLNRSSFLVQLDLEHYLILNVITGKQFDHIHISMSKMKFFFYLQRNSKLSANSNHLLIFILFI